MEETLNPNFEGIFYFTNPTSKDYTHLWNNKEYTFPAMKTVPLIIPTETLEATQEIRKRFAYDLALADFYGGQEYKRLVKIGNATPSGTPVMFNDKVLEPMIELCLKPLEKSVAKVKAVKEKELNLKGSKTVKANESLNETFKDQEVRELGIMPTTGTAPSTTF